ncbi:MAG: hypothetical protein IID53_10505 [Proteobacteria bacterium]|nr:hypothetical protein [Pseudomonadota bacterium]
MAPGVEPRSLAVVFAYRRDDAKTPRHLLDPGARADEKHGIRALPVAAAVFASLALFGD